MKLQKLVWLAAAAAIVAPLLALGAFPSPVNPSIKIVPAPVVTGAPTSPQGLVDVLAGLLSWVQVIFWLVAIFFGLYAAFLYLTARGDPEKIKTANNMLIYVVVAVVVAVIAFAIPAVISKVVTNK